MVYTKGFTKLILVGIIGLMCLMLSLKFFHWRGRLSISLPIEQAFSTSKNKTLVARVNSKEAAESTSQAYSLYQRRLPNVLIIGFSKCGTHALRTFLTLHPNVVAEDLELGFFNKYYAKGLSWYRDHMPLSLPDQIVVEKTPSYIQDKNAILRMYKYDSSLKLIVLVRDPVVRVQSLYARAVWKGENFDKSFTKWLKDMVPYGSLIKMGNYAPYIRDVYNIFDDDQVLVLDGELLSENPSVVLQKCEEFLNIEPLFDKDFFIYSKEKGFFCVNTSIPYFKDLMNSKMRTKISTETGCFKDSKGREHPQMSKQIQEHLIMTFRATTEDLFHVIGQRFNWTGFN